MDRNLDYDLVLKTIRNKTKDYLLKYKIKSLIMGVSGGLDSGVNCAVLAPICRELKIPLIGRYIQIESNKEEEQMRAEAIGRAFCTEYKNIDLTPLYLSSLSSFEEDEECDTTLIGERIRRGNIKARLRMIHLYNQAGNKKGLVIDNDNQTEHLLGFYTIGGDIGDLTPLFSLFKTEVYKLSHTLYDRLYNIDNKKALQGVIDAVPTDGLGITSSDLEQFKANSYDEVDDILFNMLTNGDEQAMKKQYGDIYSNVWNRHLNSSFKRNHPYRIISIE